MKLIFEDNTFSFETLRTLGYAPYGGADIGEVLSTAYAIKEGDFESWYTNWRQLADKKAVQAKAFQQEDELVSASDNYLKASNYYRSAEFFLHGQPDDPRLMDTWSKSQETFRQGLSLSKRDYEIVAIPYQKTTMPGYFYRVDDQPRPTLIVHGGYDSTGEELYFQVAQDALKHGYNCLTFEGPGQGQMIRVNKEPFRPDWEQVVTPVVDYLATRSDVQQDKIALMGISFGGYLASRAVAFDHRIAACIADDGLFSFQFGEAFRARGHGQLESISDTFIQEKIGQLMRNNTNVRWVIENGLFTFGAKDIPDLFKKTQSYTLANVVKQIQCPMLVCEASHDMFFKGQPEMLYDQLDSPKTLMKFDEQDSAEEHCHMGALNTYNERVFAWLNKTLANA